MPANVVKTAEDERLWHKAKQAAAEAGEAGNYAYVMGVFQRMKAGKTAKSFVERYGAPTEHAVGPWLHEVAALSGVPALDLAKAHRWGSAHGSAAVPAHMLARVCTYELALRKGNKPPPGYTATGAGVPAAARKGGLRSVVEVALGGAERPALVARTLGDVLIKAGGMPPPGYTATPGSKVGSYRKRRGTEYDYWYPPKHSALEQQIDLFSARLKTAKAQAKASGLGLFHELLEVRHQIKTKQGRDSARQRAHELELEIRSNWRQAIAAGKQVVADRYAALASEYNIRLEDYFPSGSNHAGEIRGFTEAGMSVGVSAKHVSERALRELGDLAGTGVKVFVDSGAFEEIKFDKHTGRPYDVAPITDDDWQVVLGLYDRLAEKLGSQVFIVAPDKVADQDETLRRLELYADRIKAARDKGAQIIMPIQKGSKSMADFDRACAEILGDDFIRGIPLKKDATTTEDMRAFLTERQPARVHMLGLGSLSHRYDELQEVINAVSPHTVVTMDSVRITALVGRPPNKQARTVIKRAEDEGRELTEAEQAFVEANIEPRPLTVAQDSVLEQLEEYTFEDTSSDHMDPSAYTDAIEIPESWLTKASKNRVLKELRQLPEFDRAQSKAARKNLDDWLQQPIHKDDPDGRLWYEHPVVEGLLDGAWRAFYLAESTAEKKRRAIHLLTRRQLGDIHKALFRALAAKAQTMLFDVPAQTEQHWRTPPPGYTATPGSKLGTYRKRVAGGWDYWKPGDAALHARYGEQGAPKPGEKGHRKAPERGDALDGRSTVEVAHTAMQAAERLLDDPDLHTILDPDWVADWTGTQTDREERDEIIALGELAEHMRLPSRGIRGEPAIGTEARSDLAHEILELAMASREGEAPSSWVSTRYQRHGQIPKWAAEAVLADRLETLNPRKMRLVLVDKDKARRFIERHHSALPYINERGLMYSIGIMRGDRLVAVATAGHPTGERPGSVRGIDPRNVIELTRVASDGTTQGAASKLVARLLAILPQSKRGDPDKPALFVTYQLATETGKIYSALRKRGLRPVSAKRGERAHGARAGGAEEDRALAEVDKIRWEAGPAAGPARWDLVDPDEQGALFRALVAKALDYWQYECNDELAKALRPSGKGWGPIPKGRRGGYRKPDGRGGWVYWYPEEHTGQADEGLHAGRVLVLGGEEFVILGRTGDTFHLRSERSGEFDIPAEQLDAEIESARSDAKALLELKKLEGQTMSLGYADLEVLSVDSNVEITVQVAGYKKVTTEGLLNKLKETVERFAPSGTGEQRALSTIRLRHKAWMSVAHDLGIWEQPEHYGGKADLSDAELSVYSAVGLFTGYHVPAVRDPSSFDASKAHDIIDVGDREVPVTKELYENANRVMKALASASYDLSGPATIHRGMRLSDAAADALVPGAVFDGGEIASWTGNEVMALGFSGGRAQGVGATLPVHVVFTCSSPKRGTYIDGLSPFGAEDEVVSSGEMRVKSVTTRQFAGSTIRMIEVEQI